MKMRTIEIDIQAGQEVKVAGLGKGWKTSGFAGVFDDKFFVEVERNHDEGTCQVIVGKKQEKALRNGNQSFIR